MIKIYTAFLFFLALGITTLVLLITRKKESKRFIGVSVLASLIAFVLYAPINLGIGKLVFAPFLLYTHFMESYSLANNSDYWGRMQVYLDHKNYIRIVQKYLFVFSLFFLPSLSLRLASIISLPNILKKTFYTEETIFLLCAIFFGFFIPSFFIQNIAVFVIIQFLWVTYILLLLPTAYGLSAIYVKAPKVIKPIFVLIVVLLSLPDLLSLVGTYSKNPVIIPASTIAIAKEIRENVPKNAGLVVMNHREVAEKVIVDTTVPIISALSQHDVYYEPEVLEFLGLDREIDKRKKNVLALDQAVHRCGNPEEKQALLDLLTSMKSTYILSTHDKDCLDLLPTIQRISQKGEAALYKIK